MIFNKKSVVGNVSTHWLIVSKNRRGLPDGPVVVGGEILMTFVPRVGISILDGVLHCISRLLVFHYLSKTMSCFACNFCYLNVKNRGDWDTIVNKRSKVVRVNESAVRDERH